MSIARELQVPVGFPALLQELAKDVLRNQPDDIIAFAHEHFAKLLADREAKENLKKAQEIEQQTTVFTPNKDAIVPEKLHVERSKSDLEKEEAIIKIQAGARGMMARKEMREQQKEEETPAPEENREGEEELTEEEQKKKEAAVVAIQSTFRGHQARQQLKQSSSKVDTDVEESRAQTAVPSAPKTPLTINETPLETQGEEALDPEMEEAVIKIQSTFRGHKTRQELKGQMAGMDKSLEAGDVELPPTRDTTRVQHEQSQLDVSNLKLETPADDEEEAALRIQATFRGHQARKEVEKMKSEKSEESQPSEEKIPESEEQAPEVEEKSEEKVEEKPQEEEELPDISKFSAEEIEAVKKIQGGARKLLAKKTKAQPTEPTEPAPES